MLNSKLREGHSSGPARHETWGWEVTRRLLISILDILAKLILRYSSGREIMSHILRKRKPKAGEWEERSPTNLSEKNLQQLLKLPKMAVQLLHEQGHVCIKEVTGMKMESLSQLLVSPFTKQAKIGSLNRIRPKVSRPPPLSRQECLLCSTNRHCNFRH